ncbi:MAG: hypothetical protein FJZ01_03015 [Candidatus Sericytochromatia bacterium]|nr:hypothetical protein [Candidatus Tanganyikabacteria bacterium]
MSDVALLLISNGHGEDAVAARIARELPAAASAGLPLVGAGHAYREAGIPVLGPARDLPGGGWSQRSLRAFLRDWRHGWAADLGSALAAARGLAPRLVVGVGDVLPAAFAAVAGLPPIVLVGCNKTDYYADWGESYIAAEVAALRCWDTHVLPRDAPTAERLRRLGLRVEFPGNAIPDLVEPLPPPGDGLAILPGSREDAVANLPLMLAAARQAGVAPERTRVALAPGRADLRALAETNGAAVASLHQALAPAGLVLATAGTASEVAAAHGRPIVAFAGPGPQYTPYFAARQQQLLGEALHLVARDAGAIGETVHRLLSDDAARARAAEAGRSRVGEPGAARRIASLLERRLGI